MAGLKGAMGLRNGLCVSTQVMYSNAQSRMQVSIQNNEFGMGVNVHQDSALSPLLFIPVMEALSMSSALVCRESFSSRATCCSSQTPRRSVYPCSRHGRQVWKVKSPMSTWRRPSRPSSWFLVLDMLSSRNLASIPVLPALGLSATTQSSAHSACGGSTRSVVASLSNWWPLQIMSAVGVRVRLGLSMAELWMSVAPCLIWKPLSATYVISCAPVPLLPAFVWPGESSGNSVVCSDHLVPLT